MIDRDGRNIDGARGLLLGEGALQQVENRATAFPREQEPLHRIPSEAGPGDETPTYYGQPVIKEPLWIWSIPTYFYVGGITAGAASLGMSAQLAGDPALRPFVQRCRWIAAVGCGLSAGLLIHDLGKPSRFLNMLRVFRPTSPMNLGTWVVSGAGAASGAAALLGAGRLGDAAGIASGIFALPLSGYTAVLVTTTAVPLWQAIRKPLPALFVASGAAATGSFFSLLPQSEREHRITRRLGIAGKLASVAAAHAVERAAAKTEGVDRPLRDGFSGALWKASKWLDLASLALDLAPGHRRRKQRMAAGVLGSAASLALRFAVMRAGKRSARDPKAAFRQQREGHGAREVTGVAGVVGPGEERAAR